jgi:hypothetical protein
MVIRAIKSSWIKSYYLGKKDKKSYARIKRKLK